MPPDVRCNARKELGHECYERLGHAGEHVCGRRESRERPPCGVAWTTNAADPLAVTPPARTVTSGPVIGGRDASMALDVPFHRHELPVWLGKPASGHSHPMCEARSRVAGTRGLHHLCGRALGHVGMHACSATGCKVEWSTDQPKPTVSEAEGAPDQQTWEERIFEFSERIAEGLTDMADKIRAGEYVPPLFSKRGAIGEALFNAGLSIEMPHTERSNREVQRFDRALWEAGYYVENRKNKHLVTAAYDSASCGARCIKPKGHSGRHGAPRAADPRANDEWLRGYAKGLDRGIELGRLYAESEANAAAPIARRPSTRSRVVRFVVIWLALLGLQALALAALITLADWLRP